MAAPISEIEEFPAVPSLPSAAFPEDVRATIEAHNRILQEWYEKINGHISVGAPIGPNNSARAGHLDGQLIHFYTPTANADFPVSHDLGRIPLGFITLDQDSASPLFRVAASPAHTSTQLWVRTAATAGTRFLILVV